MSGSSSGAARSAAHISGIDLVLTMLVRELDEKIPGTRDAVLKRIIDWDNNTPLVETADGTARAEARAVAESILKLT